MTRRMNPRVAPDASGGAHPEAFAQVVDISHPRPVALDMVALSGEVWSMGQIQDYLVAAVNDILRARRVPREDTSPPGMEVTVPAIEAMRYSPLRREIAALIATTMDTRRKDEAHPAFLNILSQLTRDEICLIDTMPGKDRILPIANLYVDVARNRSEVLYRNIVPEPLAEVCQAKARIPKYIDNLRRLQLIEEPTDFAMPAAKTYTQIVQQPFCKQVVDARGLRQKTRIERRVICLSDFGAAFRDVCIA